MPSADSKVIASMNLPPLPAEELKGFYSQIGISEGSKVAVGVSGGADSVALLLLSKRHYDVVAITVDHGLRRDAADEAVWAKSLCEQHDIPHVTLKWEGDKPSANLQAKAREARYELMAKWCHEKGVGYIAAAHHMDDQAETILLRLARGSGVYGLAGMAPVRPMAYGVQLVRPLLTVPKSRLMKALEEMGQDWIEDPSNSSEAFDRVKIRNMLKSPAVEGLNAARLSATAERMRRSREALEHYESKWLEKAVVFHPEGHVLLDQGYLKSEPEEIILRGLASVCRFISFGTYVPRMEKLLRLYENLTEPAFKGHTLYGAAFKPLDTGAVLVVRELAACAKAQKLVPEGTWDGRYIYTASGALDGLTIRALGEDGWVQLKSGHPDVASLPFRRDAVLSMPAIFEGEALLAVPFIDCNLGLKAQIQIRLRDRK